MKNIFSSLVVVQCTCIGLVEKFSTCFNYLNNHRNVFLYICLGCQYVNKLYAYCTCIWTFCSEVIVFPPPNHSDYTCINYRLYTCTISLVGWTMQPIPAYNKSNVRKLGFFYSCETKLNEKQKIKLIFQTKTCNRRIKNTMQITKPFKEILIERRTSCSRIIFQPFSALISQFTF